MVKDGSDAGGRRQPGEAGYGPQGATNPTLPCQTPLSSGLTAKKKPAGRRQKIASATPPKAIRMIVTTPGIKATRFRASGPGRCGFGAGLMWRECGASRLPLFLPRVFSGELFLSFLTKRVVFLTGAVFCSEQSEESYPDALRSRLRVLFL